MYYTQIAHPPAEKIGTSDQASQAELWPGGLRERNHTYIQILVAAKKSHTRSIITKDMICLDLSPIRKMVRHVADVAHHQYMYLLLVMCVYSPSY